MPQWRHSENPDFDVAALQVAPNPLGYLTDVVGGRGYTTDRSRHSELPDLRLPGGGAQRRRTAQLPDARPRQRPADDRFLGPADDAGACDMAGGSSGGAWIVEGEYIDGVTSYGYTGNPNRLYCLLFRPHESANSSRQLP